MKTIQINSGEHIGMKVLTIHTIPHMSTISASELSAQETNRILVESARDMSNLLSEIYQQYKLHVLNGETTDIALEMLQVIPVYCLECRPDHDAVKLLHDTIVEEVII